MKTTTPEAADAASPSRGQRQRPGKASSAAFAWRRTDSRRSVLIWLLSSLVAPTAFAADTFDLGALAALLAQRKSGQARFEETRLVSGIDGPLFSSGTLSFTAPDAFARHTLQPRAESMAVQGNVITLKRGGRSRQMTLDAVPELSTLVEAMRGTLTGDAVALQKHFTTAVAGTAQGWKLTLVPRDRALAAQVREVAIEGQRGDMRVVSLWLAGGDSSRMTIEPIDTAKTP
jgi:Outer membrane lipoprotein carrier protein LolA-like